MSLVFAQRHARRILQVNFCPYSTSAIFGDPKSAEFVAAAGSVDSLPRLHGLPEVLLLHLLKYPTPNALTQLIIQGDCNRYEQVADNTLYNGVNQDVPMLANQRY